MANELLTILEYIEQERGISRESLVRALESAIAGKGFSDQDNYTAVILACRGGQAEADGAS